MKILTMVIVGLLLFIAMIFLVKNSRTPTFSEDEILIQLAIFPVGTTSSSYLIEIDGNGIIRTNLGTRRFPDPEEMDDFFIGSTRQRTRELAGEDMQHIIHLAEELDISDHPLREGPDEREWIALGVWMMVLYYNGNFYEMAHIQHGDNFLSNLVYAIIELSPIHVYLRGFS